MELSNRVGRFGFYFRVCGIELLNSEFEFSLLGALESDPILPIVANLVQLDDSLAQVVVRVNIFVENLSNFDVKNNLTKMMSHTLN